MIINEQKNQVVISDGEVNSKKAVIDSSKLSKLQYMLTTGLYQDPISAVITELSNNAVDSIVESGKDPIQNPVLVKLWESENKYYLSIEDKGVGMSKDFFENFFMSMLSSTKEDSNESIGHFGIGGKSFSALERPVTFTIVKDGSKNKYLCFKGEEFIEYENILEEDTTEENGVLFEMQITDRYEFREFCEKAKKQLSYYDTVALIINEVMWENKIYRNDLFQYCEYSPYNDLHLCLKDVLYSVNWSKLGIAPVNVPVALRFSLKDNINPNPSRETLLYSKETIELIKRRIEEVANWFVERYNADTKEFDNIVDAYKYIGVSDKVVSLGDESFTINSLLSHSNIIPLDPKVKGCVLQTPLYYKTKLSEICWRINQVGQIKWNGRYTSKHMYGDVKYWLDYSRGEKRVLVDETLVGHYKEYLKEKYKSGTNFLSLFPKTLGKYISNLNLYQVPKEQWRGLITEAQEIENQVIKNFMEDMRGTKSSQDFTDYLTELAEERKANKVKGIYVGKTLNKQVGDITIAMGRLSNLDGRTPVFEKKVFPISTLYKNKYLTLLFSDEQKELASQWFEALVNTNIQVGITGKRESTRVPNVHNIKNLEEFMKTKAFRRIVTSWKIQKVLEGYNTMTQYKQPFIVSCLEKIQPDIDLLEQYVEDNGKNTRMTEFQVALMDTAEELNLWDTEIMPVVDKINKAVETFAFLQYIKIPNYWDEKDKKGVSTIINQMLLFQKKYKGAFEGWELVNTASLEGQLAEEEAFIESEEAELLLTN